MVLQTSQRNIHHLRLGFTRDIFHEELSTAACSKGTLSPRRRPPFLEIALTLDNDKGAWRDKSMRKLFVSEASGSTIVQGWTLMRGDNQHKRITPIEEGVKKWEQ